MIILCRWWPWWRETSRSTPQSLHVELLSSGLLITSLSSSSSSLSASALSNCHHCHHNSPFLNQTFPSRWGIAYRVVLNGLGIYTTWTVIARWLIMIMMMLMMMMMMFMMIMIRFLYCWWHWHWHWHWWLLMADMNVVLCPVMTQTLMLVIIDHFDHWSLV